MTNKMDDLATALRGTFSDVRPIVEAEIIRLGDFNVSCRFTGKIVLSNPICGERWIVGDISDPVVFLTATIRQKVHFCCS